MNVRDYGWTQEMEDTLMQAAPDFAVPARVVSVHRGQFKVVSQYGEHAAKLKASVYYNDANNSEAFPTVGDFVCLSYQPLGDSMIVKTLPRKSYFTRMNTDVARGEQPIAANFDYVFLMMSMNQDFNLNRLERYLTIAWQSAGTPVIVLTKADLTDETEAFVQKTEATAVGVDVVAVSAVTGIGIERLSSYLQPGKTVVFLGSSGIGKSSLVNALAGEELMEVNGIREEDDKGRHTTTSRQLHLLKNGTALIDTPGMRALGMWTVTEGLGETFASIQTLAESCRFSNCSHRSEPGCAVRAAIEKGELEEGKLKRYRQLERENDYAARREHSKQRQAQKLAGKKKEPPKRRQGEYKNELTNIK